MVKWRKRREKMVKRCRPSMDSCNRQKSSTTERPLSFLMPSKLKEVFFLKRSLEALFDCCTKLIMSRMIWARELRRKIIEVGVNCLCFLSQAQIESGWWILELHHNWNCSFCRSEFTYVTFVCKTICHSFFWFICLSFILLWTVLAAANC